MVLLANPKLSDVSQTKVRNKKIKLPGGDIEYEASYLRHFCKVINFYEVYFKFIHFFPEDSLNCRSVR